MTPTNEYKTLPFIDPHEVGNNLRALLDEHGMSQTALAEKSQVHQAAIGRAIKTGRGLSPRRWQAIADALGIPVERIFGVQKIPRENSLANL